MAQPLPDNHEFSIFVAIDFGTDGTSLGYGLPGDDGKAYVHSHWQGTAQRASIKPKTRLLLDRNGGFVAFGKNATNTYISINNSSLGLLLFERFKMALYDHSINTNSNIDSNDTQDEKSQQQKPIIKPDKVDIRDEIASTNGTMLSSRTVFVAALRYLKDQAFDHFVNNQLQIQTIDQIQWFITVPAIWSDRSKDQIAKWCLEAGLINPKIPNHLKMLYEPDCASLSIQYELLRSQNTTLQTNDKYILIDAGGGTCDVACHQVICDPTQDEFGVKEIHYPTGGPWGSTYIDDLFIKFLENKILCEAWMDEFKERKPSCYVELLESFRCVKDAFNNDDSEKNRIQLPSEFMNFIELKSKNDIESFFEDIQNKSSNAIELIEDYLSLSCDVWRTSLFDPIFEPILSHVTDLLNTENLKNECKYLFLAGGMSQNQYFQQQIISNFCDKSNYGLQSIISQRPILSVIDGAARFGLIENYIQERLLSKTYGTEASVCYDDIKNLEEYDEEFKSKNSWTCVQTKKIILGNLFDVFARKNDKIKTNEPITKTYEAQKFARLRVYDSDETDPKIITGTPLASTLMTLPEDGTEDIEKVEMIVEFHFGNTQLQVFAYPTSDPDNKEKLQLEYE